MTFTLVSIGLIHPSDAEDPHLVWKERSTGSNASLRGISVVDEKSLWASGAKATVVRSVDGGMTWQSCGPKSFDPLEFRSIVAFDEQTATIASAGTPAVILQTHDGGKTWNETFRHPSPAAFFDGMRFWNRETGMAFSDPVEGRILIVKTTDAGATWQAIEPEIIPAATEREGGFAASNSVLCVADDGLAWIGTGGTPSSMSRVYMTNNYGKSWAVHPCPLPSGPAAGVFSITYAINQKLLIAVGGDYRPEVASNITAAHSRDLGQSWQLAKQPPSAFVSAVCLASQETSQDASSKGRGSRLLVVSTGPSNSFVSSDGDSWRQFSTTGFHALGTSPNGRVFAVGADGRFGELDIRP